LCLRRPLDQEADGPANEGQGADGQDSGTQ
jgi:hypothetical protein